MINTYDDDVQEKCAFCGRKVKESGYRNPDAPLVLKIEGRLFFAAWRVHHSCLVGMWKACKKGKVR